MVLRGAAQPSQGRERSSALQDADVLLVQEARSHHQVPPPKSGDVGGGGRYAMAWALHEGTLRAMAEALNGRSALTQAQ